MKLRIQVVFYETETAPGDRSYQDMDAPAEIPIWLAIL
jgi:hypothetical protein